MASRKAKETSSAEAPSSTAPNTIIWIRRVFFVAM
jgi:hypothetical protein